MVSMVSPTCVEVLVPPLSVVAVVMAAASALIVEGDCDCGSTGADTRLSIKEDCITDEPCVVSGPTACTKNEKYSSNNYERICTNSQTANFTESC